MKILASFTLTAESKDEAMKLPVVVRQFQASAEMNRKQGAYGPPDSTQVLILVKPGRWE